MDKFKCKNCARGSLVLYLLIRDQGRDSLICGDCLVAIFKEDKKTKLAEPFKKLKEQLTNLRKKIFSMPIKTPKFKLSKKEKVKILEILKKENWIKEILKMVDKGGNEKN